MPSQYHPDKHHRRSIRLKGYDDTAAGAYFITLCAHQRQCLFGAIDQGEMQLSQAGQIVADTYLWLATQYPYIHLDQWIVMPNHFHGIIIVTDTRRGDSRIALTHDPTTDRTLTHDPTTNPTTDRTLTHDPTTNPTTDRTLTHTLTTDPTTDPTTDRTPTPNIANPKSLGRLIGAFKTVSTKQINLTRNTPGIPVWQRNYYEHIIRDDRALQHIQRYIQNNPLSWQADQLHPSVK